MSARKLSSENCEGLSKITVNQVIWNRVSDALKPQISKNYGHLFAQKTPFIDSLFGNNATKQIKDMIDDNKVISHKLLLDQGKKWSRGVRGKRGRLEVLKLHIQANMRTRIKIPTRREKQQLQRQCKRSRPTITGNNK